MSNLQVIQTHYNIDPDYPQKVQSVDRRQPVVLTPKQWEAVPAEQRHLGRYDERRNVVVMGTEKYPIVRIHAGGPALFKHPKPGMVELPAITE
jgi:hypothetical protein